MEILVIVLLTLLNGFFALSEIALVSVKKTSIERLAAAGNARAQTILKLRETPEHFLSAVQVGITLIGIVAGAYGGATLTDNLEHSLQEVAFLRPFVHEVSLVLVIGGITYFTIVIGELAPKTIALNNPEGIALFAAPIIRYFTLVAYPFVRLLSGSTKLILRLFGVKETDEEALSEEELRFLVKAAGKQGILEDQESLAHQNLFSFTDQTAKTLMTPRLDIEWIDSAEDLGAILEQLRQSVHSKFVVAEHHLDNIKGILHVKDFLESYQNPDFELKGILRAPIYVTQNTTAFNIINLFKVRKQYLGVVVDEFGAIKGVITLHDLFEAIIGDLPDEDEMDEDGIIVRDSASYLIDGKTMVYELNQRLQHDVIPNNRGRYTTVAGFVIDQLRTFPKTGDKVQLKEYVLEIIDMDGPRIDKVLMTKNDKAPN